MRNKGLLMGLGMTLLAGVLALASDPPAAEKAAGRSDRMELEGDVEVKAGEKLQGDLVAVGGSARVYGEVQGNVVAVGGSVHLHQGCRVKGDAIALGGRVIRDAGAEVGGAKVQIAAPWASRLVEAARKGSAGQPSEEAEEEEPEAEAPTVETGDLVRFGEPLCVESNQTVRGDVVCIGGPAEVLGHVTGDAVSLGGPVEVRGTVDGNLVALGGAVHLHPGAVVRGDVVTTGGGFTRDPGAILGGEQVSIGVGESYKGWKWLREAFGRPAGSAVSQGMRLAAWLASALSLLVVMLLIVFILPGPTDTVARAISRHPSRALAYGIIGWLMVLPVLVILLLLVVTWALIPFYAVAVVALVALGAVGVCVFVGRQLVEAVGWGLRSVAGLAVVGFLAVRALQFVQFAPYGGALACIVTVAVLVLALGGALMTRFGTQPEARWLAGSERPPEGAAGEPRTGSPPRD